MICFALALLSAPLQAAQQARPAAPPAAPPGPAEQYVVNMTGLYPASHPIMREVLRPWAESVLEQTGGRLVVRFFEPRTIACPNKLGRAVRLGQVGLGLGYVSSEPDDFPLSLLAAQGSGGGSMREISAAYWRMYTEIPELAGEFSGIKLLAAYATDPFQLCMAARLPYGAESLKGLRFLMETPLMAEKMESFGSLSTVIPQSDFKMFMEDKIADGLVLNLTDIQRLGLSACISGVALGDLENGVVWLGLHQGVWDMLPQDIRNILTRNSGLALSQSLGAALEGIYRADLDKLGNSAVRLHYFSAEERAKFSLNMGNVYREAWQRAAREKGYNVKALQDRIAKIMTETRAR